MPEPIRIDVDPSDPSGFVASRGGRSFASSNPDVAAFRLMVNYFPEMVEYSPEALELDGRRHSPDPPNPGSIPGTD